MNKVVKTKQRSGIITKCQGAARALLNKYNKCRKSLRWLTAGRWRLLLSLVVAVVSITAVSGLVNAATYKSRTYPNTTILGEQVGGLSATELQARLNKKLGLTNITFSHKDKTEKITATVAGFSVSQQATQDALTHKSFGSAFMPWFWHKQLPLELSNSEEQLKTALDDFSHDIFKSPKNAYFTIKNNKLAIEPDIPGYGIQLDAISKQIDHQLRASALSFKQPIIIGQLSPNINQRHLQTLTSAVNDKLQAKYIIHGQQATQKATQPQILKWLKVNKVADKPPGLIINKDQVEAYVQDTAVALDITPAAQVTASYTSGKPSQITSVGKLGYSSTNHDIIAQELYHSLQVSKGYEGSLEYKEVAYGKRSVSVNDLGARYTYSVVTWGKIKSDFNNFRVLAAQTLANPRGWSAGNVSFHEVPSGGDFTLVLAEPARVAGASPICDNFYSCRVGRYVIINDDRWRGATPSWNNAGGSLRNYRNMVVNHETGHWLGFNHRYCSGPGQFAPVMQQQSISLQGCSFNPWPTSSELAAI